MGKYLPTGRKILMLKNSFAAGLRNICYSLKKKNYKWKEGEGMSQRTCVSDPQTRTTVWGWTAGWQGGLEEGGVKGKIGTTVIE